MAYIHYQAFVALHAPLVSIHNYCHTHLGPGLLTWCRIFLVWIVRVNFAWLSCIGDNALHGLGENKRWPGDSSFSIHACWHVLDWFGWGWF
jgi:hypothetical protein